MFDIKKSHTNIQQNNEDDISIHDEERRKFTLSLFTPINCHLMLTLNHQKQKTDNDK